MTTILIGAASTIASADDSPESRFVSLINAERTQRGIPPLVRRSDLDAVAERHSERMQRNGEIYHNRNLANEIPGSYRMGGENVGGGFDVDGLHAAFMDSTGHRHNILLEAFDEVGLGVIVDPSGEVLVTEVFVDRGTASTPKPTSSPKPKPKPSASHSSQPAPERTTNANAAPAPEREAPDNDPRNDDRASVDRDRAVDLLVRIVSST